MERSDLTAHGFRSTFRDWCAEATKTEAAYQRRDLIEKRRRLMAEWAAFCSRPASIVQLARWCRYASKPPN